MIIIDKTASSSIWYAYFINHISGYWIFHLKYEGVVLELHVIAAETWKWKYGQHTKIIKSFFICLTGK